MNTTRLLAVELRVCFQGYCVSGGVSSGMCDQGDVHRPFPLVNRMAGQMQKHYLPATWFAGGKNQNQYLREKYIARISTVF